MLGNGGSGERQHRFVWSTACFLILRDHDFTEVGGRLIFRGCG